MDLVKLKPSSEPLEALERVDRERATAVVVLWIDDKDALHLETSEDAVRTIGMCAMGMTLHGLEFVPL
jgi:hypothetical protein